MTKYANRKRIEGPNLKEGDKVYLLRRNIKSNKPTKKLDAVKLGPFRILRRKGPVNYELELPRKMRILPTFHVSLLEPATPDSALEQDVRDISEEIQEPIYQVDRILRERKRISIRRHRSKSFIDASRQLWGPELIPDSRRHLQDTVEGEGRFHRFHTKVVLRGQESLLESILRLKVIQLLGNSRVRPGFRQTQLLAKADFLHPPGSQILKQFRLFLEDINVLLFNLFDVAAQGVASVTETFPLRSRECDVAMRRPFADTLGTLLRLRTDDAFRPLLASLHFGVSTFGARCHFGAVFRDFGSKVFTTKGLGGGHRDDDL